MNIFGKEKNCEHFEVFQNIKKIAKNDVLVIFNVNRQPFDYEKFPLWKKRRNEFYGDIDTSDMKIKFLIEIYIKKFLEIGFNTIFCTNAVRVFYEGIDMTHYFAYKLNLPWTGFFHKILKSDIHVIMDTNQLPRGKDFVVRNRIKTENGSKWLRVTVLEKNKMAQIRNVNINNSTKWKEKHWNSINNNYSKSPYFSEFEDQFKKIFQKEWKNLLELNMEIIFLIMKILRIKTKIIMESELNINTSSTQEILDILDKLNAKKYLTGDGSGSKKILEGNENKFMEKNIEIIYQKFNPPEYSQLYEEFLPNLSICDMLFNIGSKNTRMILDKQ
ncbi:MAG: hypothetical protein CXT78_04235 [Thaumarchaeota archaeon]|nr:MAG: hypothetical protein CXT78_04235 [Nitrososphaerota archaeon]